MALTRRCTGPHGGVLNGCVHLVGADAEDTFGALRSTGGAAKDDVSSTASGSVSPASTADARASPAGQSAPAVFATK
jgi:hypothetical protein